MASYGIHGAVDNFADLPDATKLDMGTVFLVRQDADAPSGAGLYWVQKGGSGKEWAYLDALSMQRADEVPYDDSVSGLPVANVQQAIDLLAGGGAALDTFEIHVDPVNGIDAPGRGGAASPFQTIAYAFGQVSDLGNTGADLTQWCREQIVLRLAPGEYEEGDIAFNLKRAHIALRGHGVSLLGNVDLAVELADVPTLKEAVQDDGLTINSSPDLPWPDLTFPMPSLLLQGETSAFDAGAQTRSFMVNGKVSVTYGDPLRTSNGWHHRIGIVFPGFEHVYVQDGFSVEGTPKGANTSLYAANAWFKEGYVGVNCQPDAFSHANLYLKCRDTYFGGNGGQCAIGSNAILLDVNGCWITNIDAQLHNPDGWIKTMTDGIRNTLFLGTVMRLGGSPSMENVKLDANSHASLVSREGPAGGNWDVSNVNFILADEAGSVFYDGADGQTGVWDGDAPGDLQEAVQRIAVALQTQIGAAIT